MRRSADANQSLYRAPSRSFPAGAQRQQKPGRRGKTQRQHCRHVEQLGVSHREKRAQPRRSIRGARLSSPPRARRPPAFAQWARFCKRKALLCQSRQLGATGAINLRRRQEITALWASHAITTIAELIADHHNRSRRELLWQTIANANCFSHYRPLCRMSN